MPGSSPLTRGKPAIRAVGAVRGGLIPAHAGKTSKRSASASTPRAHPRSRGENIQTCVQVAADLGSSPLTRGKPDPAANGGDGGGLIPAHAGKTSGQAGPAPPTPAHPRSRGENVTINAGWERLEGSSPLTRGKHHGRHGRHIRRGLIPAHAGKTLERWDLRPSWRAHPHSHGENKQLLVAAASQRGSSPLTQGKHQPGRSHRHQPGLIPTHTGKISRP